MWAAADEPREHITGWCRRAWAHADATVGALSLDARGHVPWWGGAEVILHRVMLHVITDTQRHAGHAVIVRELIDGVVGLLPGNDNMPPRDQAGWPSAGTRWSRRPRQPEDNPVLRGYTRSLRQTSGDRNVYHIDSHWPPRQAD